MNFADKNNNGLPLVEVDYCISQGTGISPGSNFGDWSSYNSVSGFQVSGAMSGVDVTQWHDYGLLWVPPRLNSGVGKLQYYLDGSPTGSLTNYGSGFGNTWLESLDTGLGQALFIGGNSGNTCRCDYVQVWQL